jgi:hypothetical protein
MAKKQVDLNTSCIATFKNGSTQTFNSIEEASEKTGLSVASIKIRCNKPGSSGKDKTTFEWVDSFTKRHYQAKKSKNKGSAFETEVINHLKELGFTGCCRAAGESRKIDSNKIDIVDVDKKLPVNIQCKNTQNLPNYFTIRDACTDKSKPFVMAWKKAAEGGSASPGTVFIIPDTLFYQLLKHEL